MEDNNVNETTKMQTKIILFVEIEIRYLYIIQKKNFIAKTLFLSNFRP